MKYEAHEYQEYATRFILDHPEAAVFLEMGLGKSVITLTAIRELLDRGEVQRVLVVAPLRVARDTWPEEIRKWDHLAGLEYSVAVGTERERREALSRDVPVQIINRENLAWMIEEGYFRHDMVVIDELSSFKNWQSKRFRAMTEVRPRVKRMVGLTGTPAPNGLMDLFAEFKVIDGGMRLGRYISRYRDLYFLPDKQGWNRVYSWKPKRGAEQAIYDRVRDITVSMKAMEYIRMPELMSLEWPVYMDPQERGMYDGLKEEMILHIPGHEVDAKNAAVLCGKLSQMANGAVYTEDGGTLPVHERKLEALEDLIEAANGEPVLVAWWFEHDRARILGRFPEAREIRSSADITDWNAGRIPVGLIHPASAGHGLNLQAGGHHLIWYGLTWSLELYQQTNARLWRQGQEAKTVVIHHIVCADTIDGAILRALRRKDGSQEGLIRTVRAEIGKGAAA